MTSPKFKKLSKNKRLLKSASIIAIVILLVAIGVVYAFRERAQIALVQTPNAACTFNFSIKEPSPTPSIVPSPSPSPSPRVSPSPSPSPKPSICVITTVPASHSTLCLKDPQKISLKVHVDSLPGNPPYHLISFWQLVAPTVGAMHELSNIPNIKVGETYTLTADWPGIPAGSRDTIDIMIGYNVREGDIYNGRLIGGACANGFNYYWTPWVDCP